MAVILTKTFNSADIASGREGGSVELRGSINMGVYVTGGVAVNFALIHASCVNANIIGPITFSFSTDGTTYFRFDRTNSKIMCYLRSDESEVVNATDLSASTKHAQINVHFRTSTAVSTAVTI